MSETEYKELVLADYDRQLNGHMLSSELLVPTPANIKAEVVKFCERVSELNKGDESILQSFVGVKENVAAYHTAFSTKMADPFRQVVKLIEKRKINPNIKYVNLLALVIGFPQRPYHPTMKTVAIAVKLAPAKAPAVTAPIAAPLIPTKRAFDKRILLLAAIFIIGIAGFMIWQQSTAPHGGCMIWHDDRYRQTECNGNPPGVPVYPLELNVIAQFRRIKLKDTMTQYAIGKVFWAKDHGDIQFYTDSGPCPFDNSKRLLRMSPYILENHVVKH